MIINISCVCCCAHKWVTIMNEANGDFALEHEWVYCALVTTIDPFKAKWTVARRFFERVDAHGILFLSDEINLIIYTIFFEHTIFFDNVDALKHTFFKQTYILLSKFGYHEIYSSFTQTDSLEYIHSLKEI